MTTVEKLLTNLSVARTEFKVNNRSVLSSFVKPPFFEQVNILNYEHSIALVGGRGSGKTMYLRYFSHWTQFGDGVNAQIDDLENIVLYWKPDTIFSRAIERRNLTPILEDVFFQSLITIEITKEIIGLIQNIMNHFPLEAEEINLEKEVIALISRIYDIEVSDIKNVAFELDLLFQKIYSNVLSGIVLKSLTPNLLIKTILEKLKSYSLFSNTSFKIYIDEFENFTLNQQAFINALRKHSDGFISWNVAYKTHAEISNYVHTNSQNSEQLQKQNDYREINIDQIIEDSNKLDINNFFAKILMVAIDKIRYSECSFEQSSENVRNMLVHHSVSSIIESYSKENSGFLSRLSKELCTANNSLEEELAQRVLLKPELAVALVAIRGQRNFEPGLIDRYLLNDLSDTEEKSLEEKIRHYAPSGVFKLNITSAYNNIPIYSGFDRFMILSSSNVRHFLELCYQTFQIHLKLKDGKQNLELDDLFSISNDTMHKAANITSAKLLNEVTSFAPMGQRLNIIVQRLGELFRIKHQLTPITEPEINHFGIVTDSLDEQMQKVLNQALCWNVLIQHEVTKEKNNIDINKYDYQLNPIYAPAFGISYRKMHKKKFSSEELEVLFSANNEQWIKYRDSMKKNNNSISFKVDTQAELF